MPTTVLKRVGARRTRPVSPPSLPEFIYQALRERIVSGALVPGELLRQEDLARQYSVSRVPLREALQQLQGEGLVVLRPRRGYAVTVLDGKQLVEILQLRILIEGHAGYVATIARTSAQVKALEICARELDKMPVTNLSQAQIARWSQLNQRFHDTLIAAAGRPHLHQIARNLYSKIESYIRMELSFVDSLAEAQSQHHEIVEAFRNGEAERVAIVSRLHAQGTAERFVHALVERGLLADVPPVSVTDLGPAATLVFPLPPAPVHPTIRLAVVPASPVRPASGLAGSPATVLRSAAANDIPASSQSARAGGARKKPAGKRDGS